MGSPAELTRKQVDELNALTRDEPQLVPIEVDAGGRAELRVGMREYDVVLVELRRR